ncbi:hypothetical protein BpHYR1_013736 [Brachionus plicatilis]|uniref:Uncharacterized protein n=1 Tax=Brachionus plicatilis TaxID=10195 RepID=A0A3M7PB98_BRAPC|nr:hypothetical protein BpHYR1_013736 [Brachionus plicatilis]
MEGIVPLGSSERRSAFFTFCSILREITLQECVDLRHRSLCLLKCQIKVNDVIKCVLILLILIEN